MPNTTIFAGIERVVDNICSHLSDTYQATFDVHVLYTSEFSDLSEANLRYKTIFKQARSRLGLIRVFREAVAESAYDLIIVPQIEATALVWLSSLFLKRSIILYLHGNPAMERTHWKARVLFLLARTLVIRRLACVFGVSAKQIAAFQTMFPSDRPHRWVPNPVRTFDRGRAAPGRDAGLITFVNVSRFAYQKGLDLLLEAFADLHKVRPHVRLKLVGHGSLEQELRLAIKRSALERVVAIEHHPTDPAPALSSSDIYVSTSRWEGWGLSICEALRFGLPVVATDCDFGPSDILIDARLGRLVSVTDREELVAAMTYYCDNIDEENRHAQFRMTYVDRFSAGRVVHAHAEALLFAAGRASAAAKAA